MNTPSVTFSPRPRSDGKFLTVLTFPGAANAFGGYYPAKVYRKLYTLDKLVEQIARYGTTDQRNWVAQITKA